MPTSAVPSPEPEPQFARAVATAPFFGWWIVGSTALIQFMVVGAGFQGLGPLLVPLTESLNVGRGEVAAASSVMMLISALVSPWVGKLVATRSVRGVMFAGTAALALGLLIASSAESVWLFYLGWGCLVGIALAMAGAIPCVALVCNWFTRMRGRALGLSQLGMTLSGVVIPPILIWAAEGYGLRAALLGLAVIPALILVPLIWFFVDWHPQNRGQHPDGDPAPLSEAPAGPATVGEEWTFGRALRNREVWLLTVVMGFSGMSTISVLVHLIPYGTDNGLSTAQVASTVALMNFFGMTAKPLFGTLSDYLPTRGLFASILLLQFSALLAITQVSSALGLMLAVSVFGLGFGGGMPLMSITLGRLFGTASLPRAMGALGPLMLPFILFAAPLVGFSYDVHGNYDLAFRLLLLCSLVALTALCFLRIPNRDDAPA